jgi:DNA polymerase (family 10)
MADAAKQAGLEYIAITDHSKALAMANGLDEHRVLDHAARIRALDAGGRGIRVLAGVECDIKPDGTLDLADDCLAALDIVVASVHSAFNQDRQQMTDRVLRAIENPHVDILAHPTGRRLLKREPYPLDIEAVVDAAARHGVALEINCQIERLDLNDVHARVARDRGVRLVISSDGHSRHAFGRLAWGVLMARRGWLEPHDVLNTRPFAEFCAGLRRHRRIS